MSEVWVAQLPAKGTTGDSIRVWVYVWALGSVVWLFHEHIASPHRHPAYPPHPHTHLLGLEMRSRPYSLPTIDTLPYVPIISFTFHVNTYVCCCVLGYAFVPVLYDPPHPLRLSLSGFWLSTKPMPVPFWMTSNPHATTPRISPFTSFC